MVPLMNLTGEQPSMMMMMISGSGLNKSIFFGMSTQIYLRAFQRMVSQHPKVLTTALLEPRMPLVETV